MESKIDELSDFLKSLNDKVNATENKINELKISRILDYLKSLNDKINAIENKLNELTISKEKNNIQEIDSPKEKKVKKKLFDYERNIEINDEDIIKILSISKSTTRYDLKKNILSYLNNELLITETNMKELKIEEIINKNNIKLNEIIDMSIFELFINDFVNKIKN
jgi:hypothetical protein